MWVVVGLGNPGDEYADTRHNAGVMLVERLARAWGVEPRGRLFKSRTALARRGGEDIFLVLPKTYMNRSGTAVRAVLAGKGVGPDRLVVVTDDLDIPLGEIRVRKAGGPGTHKGMISVAAEVGSEAFPRVRIGIGPCPASRDAADFVLEPFKRNERADLGRGLDQAAEALEMVLDGEIERAMTRFNKRVAPGL
ncbi:MAG TPA: aminoacyl-tRNA hydrolase [Candidatus Aminicenantes bacterium]|nr:aminoacyl-tRNA hydrolase [Candidatus Aminicenantes bacterium]HDT14083.1 aminoacyl-tRNA hydrolase [Candidatus Aminicenantes bacterium]